MKEKGIVRIKGILFWKGFNVIGNSKGRVIGVE